MMGCNRLTGCLDDLQGSQDAIGIVGVQPVGAFGIQPAEHLEATGGAAIRADIASMRHETQTTRLFRS